MKKSVLAAALGLGMLCSSCLGPNNAFNSIHSWNSRATGSKWGNELVHIGFWILPVYQLSLLGDVLIFNSIEFWGGENPIAAPKPFVPAQKQHTAK